MATKTLPQRQTEALDRAKSSASSTQRATTRAYGMQRRHFELIAEIISKEGEYREKAAYAFACILPMTNANFDSQRFLKACKVNAFTDGGNQ
jgi:type II secretory pathway component PulK